MPARVMPMLGAGLVALVLPVAAWGGFVYDEGVDGDLSDDGYAPTVLTPGPHANHLDGNVGGGDEIRSDFFRLTIPGEWTLDAIIVTNYEDEGNTTFIGIEDASVFDTSPGNLYYFGYTSIGVADVGQDILANMAASNGNFTLPLTAGDYTFWLDENGPDEPYGLMFMLTAPAGDVNCDGVVNLFDIDAFVLALTSATDPMPYSSYDAAFPDCDGLMADLDGNGAVDLFDIDPFVAAIGT